MSKLPAGFTDLPFAHRALHGSGRPENSRAAVQAALAAGYGIELDVQLSADGAAMVFHDYDLGRLTAEQGPLQARTARGLSVMTLDGTEETIPTLSEICALVAGRVPLLVEIKDQDGAMGPRVGALEVAVVEALASYGGPVAVMSFNPHSVAEMAQLAPELPRGLTTCDFSAKHWPTLPAARREELARFGDYQRTGASFISHRWDDLSNPGVGALKAAGAAVLCWTIRSAREEAKARMLADTITFEGYLAPCELPGASQI